MYVREKERGGERQEEGGVGPEGEREGGKETSQSTIGGHIPCSIGRVGDQSNQSV